MLTREIKAKLKRGFVLTQRRYKVDKEIKNGDLFVDLSIKKGCGRRYWVYLKPQQNYPYWNRTEDTLYDNAVLSGFWYEKEAGKFNCALNTRCYGKVDVINKNFRKMGIVKSAYMARKYLR